MSNNEKSSAGSYQVLREADVLAAKIEFGISKKTILRGGNMKIIRFDIFRTLLLCLVIASFAFLSGCATMFAPSSDKITINTIPEGADVYFGAQLLGKTPLTHSTSYAFI